MRKVTPIASAASCEIGRAPGRERLEFRRVLFRSAHLLAVELLESRERPGAVDGGGTTVHEEGDADRLGGFLRASAVLDRCVGVRGDAPVAFLADGDRQGD